jgi:hypothetical protein
VGPFRVGGAIVHLTQDVFLKNRDNVFNERLPRLYREALGCAEHFLDHEPAGEHGLSRELRLGDARLVVMAAKASSEDWGHWLRTLIPQGKPEGRNQNDE